MIKRRQIPAVHMCCKAQSERRAKGHTWYIIIVGYLYVAEWVVPSLDVLLLNIYVCIYIK